MANTCSRTRPRTRETRVSAETIPAARIRETGALLWPVNSGKLRVCRPLQEGWSGSSRIGPEAAEAGPQASGPQSTQRVQAQDQDQVAAQRHRQGRRGRGQGRPGGDDQRDRQGGQEGRDSRQRRGPVQEPPLAPRQRRGRAEVAPPPFPVASTTAASR